MTIGDLPVIDVLQRIYARGPVSRAGLARELGIAPSYVSFLVRDLVNKGVVREIGVAPSSGGRPCKLLQVDPELAYLIGVDIGTINCRVLVTDFLGNILASRRFQSEVHLGPDRLLNLIHQEIRSYRRTYPQIRAIGVAQSGVVEPGTGTLLFWPKVKGWHDLELKKILEAEHALPTVVEDSARTMAVAEHAFGQGKGLANFVHVMMGTGLGATLFVQGSLYAGSSGLAGELGHITIDENGELCSCGNRGCLEVYASGWAIIQRVRSALENGVTSVLVRQLETPSADLSVEMIVAAAREGDRLSATVLSEAGMHLGTALADIVNLLNPEKIILGGAVPRAAGDLLLNPLTYFLKARAFQRSVSATEVVISQLDDRASALGVALMLARSLVEKLGREQLEAAKVPAEPKDVSPAA